MGGFIASSAFTGGPLRLYLTPTGITDPYNGSYCKSFAIDQMTAMLSKQPRSDPSLALASQEGHQT